MGPDNLVTRFARNNDSSNPYLFLAKCGSGFIDIRPKCDLIYTERFGIVKTAGARTKQLQIAK